MTSAERSKALGIDDIRKRRPIRDFEMEARLMVKGTNVVFFARRNSKGEVISWTVKRQVGYRLVFLGERVNPQGLYELVCKCVQTSKVKETA